MTESELNDNQVKALRMLAEADERGVATATFTSIGQIAGPTANSLVRRGLAEYVNGQAIVAAWYRGRRVHITDAGRKAMEEA